MTDKKVTSHRTKIGENFIKLALSRFRHTLDQTLDQKGCGTFASKHEILGIITEEFHELEEAVEKHGLTEVQEELLDIAVVAIFGVACINQGTLDW